MKKAISLAAIITSSLFTSPLYADDFNRFERNGYALFATGNWQLENVEKAVESCLKEETEELYAQVFQSAPLSETVCSTEFPEEVNGYTLAKESACEIATPANNGQVLRFATNSRYNRNFTPRLGAGHSGYDFNIVAGTTPNELDGVDLSARGNSFNLVEESDIETDAFGRVISEVTRIAEIEYGTATTTKRYEEIVYFVGGDSNSFTSEFSFSPLRFAECFKVELASRSLSN